MHKEMAQKGTETGTLRVSCVKKLNCICFEFWILEQWGSDGFALKQDAESASVFPDFVNRREMVVLHSLFPFCVNSLFTIFSQRSCHQTGVAVAEQSGSFQDQHL